MATAKDHNDVGFRLLKQLLEKEDKFKAKNIVFSPLSIYMMLTLLAAGASDGQTLDDLLSFLNFKSIEELNSFLSKLFPSVFRDTSVAGGPCVTTANGVWIADDLSVTPSFQTLLETLYRGKLNLVDFVNKSRKVVKNANAWVNKQTHGLIPKILTDIDKSTRMILANAVYFKAAWLSQFSDELTKHRRFHLLDGSSLKLPFMSSSSFDRLPVSVFDSFKVASLPYDNGRDYGDRRGFSMLIFLPNNRDGLPSLLQKACSESGFIDRHIPPHSVEVNKFRIPKFKFDFQFNPVQILKDLGLGSLFTVGSGFTKMVENPAGRELYVSNMFHKAAISVNEEGTEASAVTVCKVSDACCLMNKKVKINFVADHPFLFVIKEKVSGAVVFMGQVLDPSLG